MKLRDDEIQWNQKFNEMVKKEIQKPLPKYEELDPRLALLKKQNLELPPQEYGQLLKRFFVPGAGT
jgi:hypothetical protein